MRPCGIHLYGTNKLSHYKDKLLKNFEEGISQATYLLRGSCSIVKIIIQFKMILMCMSKELTHNNTFITINDLVVVPTPVF